MYWVYILKCADNAYYVGSHRGPDVDGRVAEHNTGKYPKAWTCSRRPVRLVWNEEFQRPQDAIAVERQIKGWSRAKKEAVIRRDWAALPELAARKRSFETRPTAG